MNGVVVRGIAGQRHAYEPIESQLTSCTDPCSVADAIADHFGIERFYIADLDAIQFQKPNAVIQTLLEKYPRSILDAGIRDLSDVEAMGHFSPKSFVVGLETLASWDALQAMGQHVGWSKLVFSLDLKNGRPLATSTEFQESSPIDIARTVYTCGIRTLIVLDLAAVGVGNGVTTLTLCDDLHREFPDLQIITGGGVRNLEDLFPLKNRGISEVLIASAIHSGAITTQTWPTFS